MSFVKVLESLKIIRSYCGEMTECEQCRLHAKDDRKSCAVSRDGNIPANWEFDLDMEVIVPSIFK